MAGKASEKAVKEVEMQEEATPQTKENTQKDSVYKVSELAENAAHLFKTKPECVTAALKAEKKETATVAEAKAIVAKFLEKEVE